MADIRWWECREFPISDSPLAHDPDPDPDLDHNRPNLRRIM